MSLFDLTDKVAVVTGSSKGIGLGIVQQMAAHGAKVVVCSRDQKLCDDVASELNQELGRGHRIAAGFAYDLEDINDGQRLAELTRDAFGRVDSLVCNAATFPFIGPAEQTDPEDFNRILIGNVHHNFRLCHAFRPDLAATRGSIITIGSSSANVPSPRTLAYAAAKAALVHMSLSLADEFVADGIRVNCVAPGLVRSYTSIETLGDEGLAREGARIPLGRVGEPEDIAGAVIFLASRAGSFVTGEYLTVDGGGSSLSPTPTPSAFDNMTIELT